MVTGTSREMIIDIIFLNHFLIPRTRDSPHHGKVHHFIFVSCSANNIAESSMETAHTFTNISVKIIISFVTHECHCDVKCDVKRHVCYWSWYRNMMGCQCSSELKFETMEISRIWTDFNLGIVSKPNLQLLTDFDSLGNMSMPFAIV